VKQTAADTADAVSAGVSKADDVLRDMIEHHPYTTALIALGVGMLIGKLSSRHY
jgi:ElaB/YqjD/DUF883 family membrane-anchored ribosome-binding protein